MRALGLAACANLVPALVLSTVPVSARMIAPPPSQAQVPTEPTQCAFGGWQRWQGGREDVRSAPDRKAPVVGTLPVPDKARDYPVTLYLIGTEPGWLHVSGASDAQNEDDGYPHRAVNAGEGWVRPDVVKLGIQSGRGYLRPDTASRRILDLGDKWLTEVVEIAQIRGCSGEWILLDYQFTGAARDTPTWGRAWFRGVCAISETTCDMKSVDTEN